MAASISISDIFDEYIETLENLPSEVEQNMHELRAMDEDYQKLRDNYNKLKKYYYKQARLGADLLSPSQVGIKLQVEKEYKNAIKRQDQKIDLTMRMCDLVSRHIERIDQQIEKHGISLDPNEHEIQTRLTESTPTRKRSRSPLTTGPRARVNNPLIADVLEIDPNEPLYCFCNQVSFGEMVACDGPNCEKEWFHYGCVGLVEPPEGKWFCADCLSDELDKKKRKIALV